MTDILAYLASKGLVPKMAGADNVHVPCVYCGEDQGDRGRLYVNVNPTAEIPGLHICFRCGVKGSLVSLQKHFGDASERQESEDRGGRRVQILDFATDYYQSQLDDHMEVLQYLTKERGLSPQVVATHRLGYAPLLTALPGEGLVLQPVRNPLFKLLRSQDYSSEEIQECGLITYDRTSGQVLDFLNGHITIPYLVTGNVQTIRGRAFGRVSDEGSKYVTGPGQKARLFNTDSVWGAEQVFCVEGELDAMVLESLGYEGVVGVPGANTWQPKWNDYFADAKRIWIVFDSDLNGVGQKAAQKVKDELGARARIVSLPEPSDGKSKTDVSTWIVGENHTRADFELLLRRTPGSLVTVAQAIAEHAEMIQLPGLRFGFEEFDRKWLPGLLPSQVAIILASTGVGKSASLINFFQRACLLQPDIKILYVSLEQTRYEWWERARRLYRFFHLGASDNDAEEFWQDRIWLDDRNRLTAEQFLALLDDFKYEVGQKPDLVAVDYLGYWSRAFKGESYQRTSDAVMAMKEIAKSERLRIISPHQVNRSVAHGTEPDLNTSRDSVTGDTRVLLANGDYIPIADLVGTTTEVVTVGADYNFTTRPTVRIWEKGIREVVRTTLESGRVFRSTPEHPVLTADRDWMPVSRLNVGERIAVPDDLPYFGSERIPHAELLGHLITNGGLTTSPITFCCEHRDIRDHCCVLARAVGVDPVPRKGQPIEMFLSNRPNGGRRPNPVTDLVREWGLFGLKSPDRYIPEFVFRGCQDDVAAVLRTMFANDGDVTNQGVRLSTASERLARDVQHLLSRFGIRSWLNFEPYSRGAFKQEGGCWRVHVEQYQSVLRFARKIGSVGHKQRKLDKVVLAPRGLAHHVDLFPSTLWDELHAIRKKNELGWSVLSKTGNPKRTGIMKNREIRRDRLAWFAEQVGAKRLRDLCKSPLIFERIVSSEPDGIESVYDMTVVGTHNFVGDAVYSNSGVVDETADFVFALWRTDTQSGKTIIDHNGEANLKIQKSRHGGTGFLHRLRWAPLSMAFTQAGEPQHQLAENELAYMKRYGETWEDCLMRHEAGTPVDASIDQVHKVWRTKQQLQIGGTP